MNNENNALLHNDVEINASEENIILAPPVELFDEAKEIAQSTHSDEKFPFALQYDSNQKEFLLSMLEAVGAIVEDDDDDGHILATMMNMTQLAFIKQLDCVERVKTDEGINPFLAEEAVKLTPNQQEDELLDDVVQVAVTDIETETLEVQTEIALNRTTDAELETVAIAETEQAGSDIAVASVTATERSSCCSCPTNVSMETAATISDESYTSGYICCPGAEQWFKFVATRIGRYTICTTGNLDTVGTLYDCCGNQITRVDDYAPCGKINFRIICNLTEGNTYYIKVGVSKGNVGSYTLRVTERVFANYVNINKTAITLEKGVTYELPITPNYTYKGYNGAQRIPGLSVSISPSNANEQKIWWWKQYGDVLDCSYGWDDDGDRYIHVTATEIGTAKLYAQDWNENGKRDECTVTVVTPYEKRLQDLAGFSNEATALILKLYNKVDNLFISENALQKAWRCARLLSEFSYNSFSFNDVAGSLTNQDNRQSYFMTTLGYTENEYTALSVALSNNHTDGNTIDFTHLQYSLAARLAYTLDKDGLASNLGSQFKTGNWGIYSDEDISYLGGWLGDATLRNDGGTGVPIMKNDDYMSDLDAENVYRLLLQGYTSIDAMNVYYSNMNASNTRADMFLQYIPYSTVKQKIFYELIDAQLYIFLSNASSQGDIYMTNYWLNLINDEEYHFNEIKSKYSDTYDFLMSLNDRLPTIKHYS